MAELQHLQRLDYTPNAGFSLFRARSAELDRNVTLKVWDCRDVAEADAVLKSAFRKVVSGAYSAELLTITFEKSEPQGEDFSLKFVWNTDAEAIDQEIIRKCESSLPVGKQGYRNKAVRYCSPSSEVKVKEAWSEHLQQTVLIKKYLFTAATELNDAVREALVQAKVTGEHTCRLLDVCLTRTKKARYRLHVVIEKPETDLEKDVADRALSSKPYTEEELLQILTEVVAGLLSAKGKGYPHRDLRPGNLFISSDGVCKVGNFAVHRGGDLGRDAQYASPEVAKGLEDIDLFAADVYSLGLTILHLAQLAPLDGIPAKAAVAQSRCSSDLQRLLLHMLHDAPNARPTLEGVRAVSCQLRESVLQHKSAACELADKGTAHLNRKEYEEALQYMQAANGHFAAQFESCVEHPGNVGNWGEVLRLLGRTDEAVERYKASETVFRKYHPTTIKRAINLTNWGFLLLKQGECEAAAEKFAAADEIHVHHPTALNNALNLMDWADSYRRRGLYSEALEKSVRADSIFSKCFPTEEAYAINLANWGLTLKCMGDFAHAQKKYAQADAAYTANRSVSVNYAMNLFNWGCLLEEMGSLQKAAEKVKAAHSVFERLEPEMARTHSLIVLTRLKAWMRSPPVSPRRFN